MLLVALHNLDKRPLRDYSSGQEQIRFVEVQIHPNLLLLDTVGLSYDKETDYGILRMVLRGASLTASTPAQKRLGTLAEQVLKNLRPSARGAVHKLVWVKSSDDTDVDRSAFMDETRQLVLTQSAPHLAFFECPVELPTVSLGHTMYDFVETEGETVCRSPMRELAALEFLTSLLIQCVPLQASRLR